MPRKNQQKVKDFTQKGRFFSLLGKAAKLSPKGVKKGAPKRSGGYSGRKTR